MAVRIRQVAPILLCLGSITSTALYLYTMSSPVETGGAFPQLPTTAGFLLHPDAVELSPSSQHSDAFVVFTNSCQIPDVDPWHPSLLPYVKQAKSLNCHDTFVKPDLTFVKGDVLFVNDSNIAAYGSLGFCEFVDILRPKKGDSTFDLGSTRYVFKDRISLSKREFIKVYCYSQNETLIYQNLHAMTPTRLAERHAKEALFLRHKARGYAEFLNVLMIGIDSVSRLNFMRQFPKTRQVLMEKLDAFEFTGYNKVRDNTFVNLVPMFLGKYIEETGWDEDKAQNLTFDDYYFSWKKFASAGYHTLFAEDAPSIAIWNFEKPGFLYTPADYYFRPFALAMAAAKALWRNNFHCFGEQLETDIVLEYNQNFIRSRQKSPYFAFTFLTRATYDSVNQNTDESHSRFLESLIKGNLLENTMVIFFSDHGARRGDILSTYIGKLEERLPALYISVPSWFHRKYPEVAKNLAINQRRLVTPFDINVLLDDVLRFSGRPRANLKSIRRGISLFDEIPAERSCEAATIDDHWCTCLQRAPVSIATKKVQLGANAIVKHLNKLTSHIRDRCTEYKLQAIRDAMIAQPNHKLLTLKVSVNDVIGRKEYYGESAQGTIVIYLLTIEVAPSSGVYEASVKFDSTLQTYTVTGDVSRITLYGNASWCVNEHSLKKVCFCVQQSPA